MTGDNTVRVWDAETRECVEIIEGGGDVEAIAGGAERSPFRALHRGEETVIQDGATGSYVAHFALFLSRIATHSSGRTWGAVGRNRNYFAIIKLEGEPEAVGGA